MRRRPTGPRVGGGRLKREDTICQAADRLAGSPPWPSLLLEWTTPPSISRLSIDPVAGVERGFGHKKECELQNVTKSGL